MKVASVLLGCVLLLIFLAAMPSAPAPPQLPSGKEVVAPMAYVSLAPVGRGSAFQLAVVLKIRQGFHINARQASLNVYEDKVVIRMALSAQPDAPLGAQHIPLKLRYQACSLDACLPPVTLNVDAAVTVAAANISRPAHPELFPAQH